MDVVTKEATATVEAIESGSPTGAFDVVLSTAALDRDGEELRPEEWKTPLPDRITFDSDHGMSVATTVGSGRPFINGDGQLQVRGTFASTPHAQTVRALVNEGHISTTSVAFKVHRSSGGVQRELLNGAFVAVPANPEAIVLSSKSVDDIAVLKAAASNALQDRLQAIHDYAVDLGAMCSDTEPDADDTTKSVHKTSGAPSAGTPMESTEESTAPTAAALVTKAAAADAADESADSVALRARALAMTLNTTVMGTNHVEE